MQRDSLVSSFALGFVLSFAGFIPGVCLAQEQTEETEAHDSGDCEDLTVLSKLTTSVILSCHAGNPVKVTMPLSPDAQGNSREKVVSGAYQFREYKILQADQQEPAFDNLMQLLPIAGFTIKYSYSPSTITARKENTWILVNLSGEIYSVSVVEAKEQPWLPVTDAEGISREMSSNSRVAIYGIEFSPDGQSIVEENSKILDEVLKYLKANPGLTLAIESHKMSQSGNPQADEEVTRKRAKAVANWLEAHGINGSRLQPKGLGRTRPIADNDSALEVQQNERIELAKPAL